MKRIAIDIDKRRGTDHVKGVDAGGIENLCSTVVLGVDLIDALLGIVDVSV